MTELITAMARYDLGEVKRLLASGTSVNGKDSAGRTPLMHAVIDGRAPIVLLLVQFKADVNLQDKAGWAALHFAAQDFRPELTELLCRSGAMVDVADHYGNTPLWRAVFNSRGRGEVIRILLAHSASPSLKNKAGVSPLDLAGNIANYNVKQFL